MADLIGNPNIAAGVQVPNQMTLGDMVNMARGIQAYKQAEQINPLAVRKAIAEAATQLACLELELTRLVVPTNKLPLESRRIRSAESVSL